MNSTNRLGSGSVEENSEENAPLKPTPHHDTMTTSFRGYRFEVHINSREPALQHQNAKARLQTDKFTFILESVATPAPVQNETELVLLKQSDCCTFSIYARNDLAPVSTKFQPIQHRLSTPCCSAAINVTADVVDGTDQKSTTAQDFNKRKVRKNKRKVRKKIRGLFGSTSLTATPLKDLLISLQDCCTNDRKSIDDINRQLSELSSSSTGPRAS